MINKHAKNACIPNAKLGYQSYILENFIVQVHVANNETYIIYNLTFAIFNFTDNTLYIILINFESSNIPSYAQKY